ncbi:MAG: bifunctional tetrahydrofolate synthase/dihydrofolate synthase [Gammaproteobacteria bacterium]|nr:bifunctional tetrahydrofolate synthase/dihydrofolate synthase [Gammaproteobacteria bacterium]
MSAPFDLASWLRHIEALHPREMDFSDLGRVRELTADFNALAIPRVLVAGTNGKGSAVALLESIWLAAGYRVGAYFSPHLLRFNERIRINGQEVDDAALCEAFARVEVRRRQALTYFEFVTAAAAELFCHARLDVAILEVGLGGRLDAVNTIDPDVALVTQVGLDHQAWLGDDRERIGAEKAGILRAGRPAVCTDREPPASLLARAAEIDAPLAVLGRDFDYRVRGQGWDWREGQNSYSGLPWPALRGARQLDNAAGALAVLARLAERLPAGGNAIRPGLLKMRLAGRFQVLPGQPACVLDVAHNPDAARALAEGLAAHPVQGQTLAVFSALGDKDGAGMLSILKDAIDHWYVAPLGSSRGASRQQLQEWLAAAGLSSRAHLLNAPVQAFEAARTAAQAIDRVVVFGSFETVGVIMRYLDRLYG